MQARHRESVLPGAPLWLPSARRQPRQIAMPSPREAESERWVALAEQTRHAAAFGWAGETPEKRRKGL
ncbi:hypothetical protein cyc_04137 [Cyclospora cayetanensis]|uniref:Uncharacterized protein n=1 Tax=Cyclospora cayetanensis TaxID=88456 RepID=A0A1D3D243_9EIME|nr:hypothetical protein cyc_04137 [Cyclospora cayetanensis]